VDASVLEASLLVEGEEELVSELLVDDCPLELAAVCAVPVFVAADTERAGSWPEASCT